MVLYIFVCLSAKITILCTISSYQCDSWYHHHETRYTLFTVHRLSLDQVHLFSVASLLLSSCVDFTLPFTLLFPSLISSAPLLTGCVVVVPVVVFVGVANATSDATRSNWVVESFLAFSSTDLESDGNVKKPASGGFRVGVKGVIRPWAPVGV